MTVQMKSMVACRIRLPRIPVRVAFRSMPAYIQVMIQVSQPILPLCFLGLIPTESVNTTVIPATLGTDRAASRTHTHVPAQSLPMPACMRVTILLFLPILRTPTGQRTQERNVSTLAILVILGTEAAVSLMRRLIPVQEAFLPMQACTQATMSAFPLIPLILGGHLIPGHDANMAATPDMIGTDQAVWPQALPLPPSLSAPLPEPPSMPETLFLLLLGIMRRALRTAHRPGRLPM